MAARTGPVLIQLPATLRFHKEKVSHFFAYLKQRHGDYRFSLEARHNSWLDRESLDLLGRYHVGWVIADSGSRFASTDAVTSRHIYLRFHGPDGSYAMGYSKDCLTGYAARCLEWRNAGYDVWVFFNNDVHGHAIRDALALKELVGTVA